MTGPRSDKQGPPPPGPRLHSHIYWGNSLGKGARTDQAPTPVGQVSLETSRIHLPMLFSLFRGWRWVRQ